MDLLGSNWEGYAMNEQDLETNIRIAMIRPPEQVVRDFELTLENIKIIADAFSTCEGAYSIEALKTISNIAKKALT
jgi:hypothetical protein